jgi:nitrogen fixation NifU-like protein
MQIESLYQDIILDHYRHPRGAGLLAQPAASAFHVNPTCGDEITVQVSTNPDGTLHIGYEGQGCSISQASASVMSELVDGRPASECDRLHEEFLQLMHSRGAGEPDEESLGDGVAFVGVSKYPARIKCALLPWMALQDARQQMEEE